MKPNESVEALAGHALTMKIMQSPLSIRQNANTYSDTVFARLRGDLEEIEKIRRNLSKLDNAKDVTRAIRDKYFELQDDGSGTIYLRKPSFLYSKDAYEISPIVSCKDAFKVGYILGNCIGDRRNFFSYCKDGFLFKVIKNNAIHAIGSVYHADPNSLVVREILGKKNRPVKDESTIAEITANGLRKDYPNMIVTIDEKPHPRYRTPRMPDEHVYPINNNYEY